MASSRMLRSLGATFLEGSLRMRNSPFPRRGIRNTDFELEWERRIRGLSNSIPSCKRLPRRGILNMGCLILKRSSRLSLARAAEAVTTPAGGPVPLTRSPIDRDSRNLHRVPAQLWEGSMKRLGILPKGDQERCSEWEDALRLASLRRILQGPADMPLRAGRFGRGDSWPAMVEHGAHLCLTAARNHEQARVESNAVPGRQHNSVSRRCDANLDVKGTEAACNTLCTTW